MVTEKRWVVARGYGGEGQTTERQLEDICWGDETSESPLWWWLHSSGVFVKTNRTVHPKEWVVLY